MKITFTGIDSFTNLDQLSKKIEYGILFSVTNNTNRYPSFEEIAYMSSFLKNRNFELALHVCGNPARKMLLEEQIHFIDNFKRIQVNGTIKPEICLSIAEIYPSHEIIFQYNFLNKHLLDELRNLDNVSFLVDNSGGKGISPSFWENPDNTIKFGYAGGLGLDNILTELEKIKFIARDDFWIDMEGKLRDENDKFDVSISNAIFDVITNNNSLR